MADFNEVELGEKFQHHDGKIYTLIARSYSPHVILSDEEGNDKFVVIDCRNAIEDWSEIKENDRATLVHDVCEDCKSTDIAYLNDDKGTPECQKCKSKNIKELKFQEMI